MRFKVSNTFGISQQLSLCTHTQKEQLMRLWSSTHSRITEASCLDTY